MATPRPKAINHRFTESEWAELDAARMAGGFPSVTAYVVATALSDARKEQRTITIDGVVYTASNAEVLAWTLAASGHPATANNGRVVLGAPTVAPPVNPQATQGTSTNQEMT
jgi:hypothetical protein